MSLSPNSALVQRSIQVHYANQKRSSSLKWIGVNAVFLAIFVYDLWCKCPGHTSALHCAELCAAALLAGGVALHAHRLLLRAAPPPLPLTRAQLRLLGLAAADLDSSFILSEDAAGGGAEVARAPPPAPPEEPALSLALPPRAWRPPAAHPAPHPAAPPRTPSPAPSPAHSPAHSPVRDPFIADRRSLAEYLRQYEERAQPEPAAGAPAWAAPAATALAPSYQLAALDTDGGSKLDESSPQGSPQVWWRLHLDPQRLTQFNLNLRLWLHVTIVERVAREVRAADAALARLGLAGVAEAGGAERLRAAARAHPAALPALPALLPFLEPFADVRYAARRVAELARGGCLSEYRWDGGGAAWDDAKPTDAELVLHLFATYMDGQMAHGGAGGERAFSSQHLSAAPAPPPRGPRALALHRVAARPPHYALALAGDTLELARGRHNLLHALLLLLAAAARRTPPALGRTHLGPAGLNMLWIIGRT